MSNINEQIEKTNEQIEQLQNKKKKLMSKRKAELRKKRLIKRGAILESVIGNSEDFSNEQIQSLLIEIFSSESARAKIENLREHTPNGGQRS